MMLVDHFNGKLPYINVTCKLFEVKMTFYVNFIEKYEKFSECKFSQAPQAFCYPPKPLEIY